MCVCVRTPASSLYLYLYRSWNTINNFTLNLHFQPCPFPTNLLQLANDYRGMTKQEVSQTNNSTVCDGSLNSLDQQLNISLMKLNSSAQKNNLPYVSSNTESCSNMVPVSCSGHLSCSSSHQSPPVYSPIGFPRNLSSRSSNHSQQVIIIFNSRIFLLGFTVIL